MMLTKNPLAYLCRTFLFAHICSWALADTTSQLKIVCAAGISSQIPLALPTQGNSYEEDESQLLQTYTGFLELNSEILDPEALLDALNQNDPFALTGTGDLWPASAEGLEKIRRWVDSHSQSDQLRQMLLKYLARKTSKLRKRDQKKSVHKQKTSKTPPLSFRKLVRSAPEYANGLRVSPDGKVLAITANSGDTTFIDPSRTRNYHLKTLRGLPHNPEQLQPILDIAFSSDSSVVAVALPSHPGELTIEVRKTDSFRLLHRYTQETTGIKQTSMNARDIGWFSPLKLQFSPNDRLLSLCGGLERRLDLVLDYRKKVASISNEPIRYRGASSGVFSHDNRFYFVGTTNNVLRAYDVESGFEFLGDMITFDGREHDSVHKGRGISQGENVVSHPHKPWIISQSWEYDGYMRHYVHSYEKLEKRRTGRIAIAPNTDEGGVRWTIEYVEGKDPLKRKKKLFSMAVGQGEKAAKPFSPNANAGGMRISPDGRYLVSYGFSDVAHRLGQMKLETTLNVYSFDNWGRPLRSLGKYFDRPIKKWEFSQDGQYLLLLDDRGILRVFEVNTKSKFSYIGRTGTPEKPIANFAVTPDSRKLFLIEGGRVYETRFFQE